MMLQTKNRLRGLLFFLMGFIFSFQSYGQAQLLFEQEGLTVTYDVNYDGFTMHYIAGGSSKEVPQYKIHVYVANHNPDTAYFYFWMKKPSSSDQNSIRGKLAGGEQATFVYTTHDRYSHDYRNGPLIATDLNIHHENVEAERIRTLNQLCDAPADADQKKIMMENFSGKWLHDVSENWLWHDSSPMEITEDGYIHISKYKNRGQYKRNHQIKYVTYRWEICGDKLYFDNRKQSLEKRSDTVIDWKDYHSIYYTKEKSLKKDIHTKGRKKP